MTIVGFLKGFTRVSTGIILICGCGAEPAQPHREQGILSLNLRSKALSKDSISFVPVSATSSWHPQKTAIIVTDMWDRHWCKGATSRVAELAPAMNKVIAEAREKGVLIVYAPSDCTKYYKDYPGRKIALQFSDRTRDETDGSMKLPSEKNQPWPVDQSNEGCNDTPRCRQGNVWTKQISALEVTDKDIISDSGIEIEGLFKSRGIKNVMLMGVHTNMCIIHRPFGLRNMKRYGMNVVLVRDLTDAMYDSRQYPHVNHFAGVGLVIDYIEKYISPTILSSDITGSPPFIFKEDAEGLAIQ